MRTRSLILWFLVANKSRYVSFSGSFLVSPFWILSISAGNKNVAYTTAVTNQIYQIPLHITGQLVGFSSQTTHYKTTAFQKSYFPPVVYLHCMENLMLVFNELLHTNVTALQEWVDLQGVASRYMCRAHQWIRINVDCITLDSFI